MLIQENKDTVSAIRRPVCKTSAPLPLEITNLASSFLRRWCKDFCAQQQCSKGPHPRSTRSVSTDPTVESCASTELGENATSLRHRLPGCCMMYGTPPPHLLLHWHLRHEGLVLVSFSASPCNVEIYVHQTVTFVRGLNECVLVYRKFTSYIVCPHPNHLVCPEH